MSSRVKEMCRMFCIPFRISFGSTKQIVKNRLKLTVSTLVLIKCLKDPLRVLAHLSDPVSQLEYDKLDLGFISHVLLHE